MGHVKSVRLGVDFGTSNTVAVLALPNRDPRPLLFDGSPLLPSAVCADATGRIVVGRDALHAATIDPGSFEPCPKRCIDDETVLLGDRSVPVVEMIAAVLHRVAAEATRAAGGASSGEAAGEATGDRAGDGGDGPLTEVVLTCPAGWAAGRRDTLRRAAATAFPGVRLVAEPVAAASHFVTVGADLPVGGTAVVYDFGAGTFDASVIRRTVDGFEVLATEGLNDCGGLDIDAAIVESLGTVLHERPAWARLMSPDSPADRRARRQFWDNVRQSKEMLSRAANTLIHVPLVEEEVPIGREQVDAVAAPILARTVEAVRAALRVADVDRAGAIFLAGGSSRMPAVTTVLHRAFGIMPTVVDQPELAVAEGSIHNPAAVRSAPVDGPSWPTVDLTKHPATTAATGPRRRILVAAAAVVLVAATLTAVVTLNRSDGVRAPRALTGSSIPASTSANASAGPSVSYAPGVDPCLVGTWREVTGTQNVNIDGNDVPFAWASGGQVPTYRADGTVSIVFDNRVVAATVRGVNWEQVLNGWANGRYTAGAGRIIYTSWVTGGTWEVRRNGRRNNGGALFIGVEPDSYVCSGDTLSIGASFYSATLTRVKA